MASGSRPSQPTGPAGHAAEQVVPSRPLFDAGTGIARALFDQSPFSSVIYDADGRVLAINAAFTRLMGITQQDLTSDYSILRDAQLEAAGVLPLIRRAFEGETVQLPLVRYDAAQYGGVAGPTWTQGHLYPVRDGDGRVVQVVLVHVDLTARVAAEEALEASRAEQESTLEELSARSDESEEARIEAEWAQEQWHFLADSSRILAGSLEVESTLATVAKLAVPRIADWCIVHVMAEDGTVRRIEAAHADPQQIAAFREFDRRYGSDPALGASRRVMKSGQSELYPTIGDDILSAWARDEAHLRRLRSLHLYSAMIVPLNAGDRVLGAITLVSAGSRRRYDQEDLAFAESLAGRAAVAMHTAELYQNAQQANRAKADFLAVMSHELRTPLNAILGYSDLLTEGISGALNERQQEQLGRIAQSARHLTDLIDAILTFARLEAGRDEVRTSTLDIADVAGEALAFIEPAAAKKGLSLESSIVSVTIRSDVAKLRQILLNLLSNAVKFTSAGFVRLTVATRPGWCDVHVSDSGPGISAGDQARIWEPFTQLEASLTRRSGGTGLGLPVSLNLATLLGGTIELESAPGQGSTFTLRIPVHPLSPEEPAVNLLG